jgi:hypothetical protein
LGHPPGDVRTVGLGELHGERSHSPGRAVDQDLLAGFDPSFIANTLQRERPGGGDRRCLLEREAGRLPLEPGFRDGRVLGECAAVAPQVRDEGLAEDLVA